VLDTLKNVYNVFKSIFFFHYLLIDAYSVVFYVYFAFLGENKNATTY